MDNAEAKELGELRRKLRGLALPELARVAVATLDELIDVCRQISPGNIGVETAAAVAAELHTRNLPVTPPPVVRSPMVGNA